MNRQGENRATLANINDKVRAFYNRRPYPPPVRDLDDYRLQWADRTRRRADFHLLWPDQPYREGLNILVAGCGTSQAARHALRNRKNRVTGIDVSSTSIEHTDELKRRYRLDNLDIYQLDIERVHELNQHFDLIICTGVLHHLADPDTGLSALQKVLEPEGAMHVMVYATYGRTGVYMLQEYCRRLGIKPSDSEIHDLANTLMALPPGHPLAHLLGTVSDFRTKAGLADALLHPQDRAYTVPQFFEFIERAGLIFGRWLKQAPYLPRCGDLAKTPHGLRLAELSRPEQYAAVELLRGTMVRHTAIVFQGGPDYDRQPISFDGPQWQIYIPIRLPHTLCIEENPPAGAAAVLLNQSHTYPDLVLPIDADQVLLLNAIDGLLTIDEILDRLPALRDRPNCLDQARTFFEMLWFYDQIVFDASRCKRNTR